MKTRTLPGSKVREMLLAAAQEISDTDRFVARLDENQVQTQFSFGLLADGIALCAIKKEVIL